VSDEDRQKWNERYGGGTHGWGATSPFLQRVAQLPSAGRVLDVAGGTGRNALWLASRGLDVTIADISAAGLAIARERAAKAGVPLHTLEVDLEADGLPEGPWDMVLSIHYLQRSLFAQFPRVLALGGLFVFLHPTVDNLERHAKPPRQLLLDRGELATLVQGLTIIELDESWSHDGFHEARLIARR
jgi:SAM-dependent methyltransferase